MLVTLINEFKNSIKSPDTEEKLDLILYRPFGYLTAKLANSLSMTPALLSIIGLYFGFLASYYYLHYQDNSSLIQASFYLIISGIFDSADGQLARISNQSTKIGLVLDGICDSIVTIAIYMACSWPFLSGHIIFFPLIVCFALYLHSCQCALLDFYHREYLYFGCGKTDNDTYWNPGINEGIENIENSSNNLDRFMNRLRLTWIKKQQWLTTRSDLQRKSMREFFLSSGNIGREEFMNAYKRHNLWLLPFWRLIGVNAHTVLIIIFMFMHRFDIYLIFFDLIIFNFIILAVSLLQRHSDRKFFAELKIINGYEN